MLESQFSMKNPTLVLASNSPRRQQLVKLLGFPFVVQPADVDETQLEGEDARVYVERLAVDKARATVQLQAGWVIAADTIVVDQGILLGKPKDAAQARAMLHTLRGRAHEVYSAFAIQDPETGQMPVRSCKTVVWMREYSDLEIDAYVASGDPLDKAGAYAIQNADFMPVERVEGCYASVMGMPLCHMVRSLRQMGIETEVDVPAACQSTLGIVCDVFESILSSD